MGSAQSTEIEREMTEFHEALRNIDMDYGYNYTILWIPRKNGTWEEIAVTVTSVIGWMVVSVIRILICVHLYTNLF